MHHQQWQDIEAAIEAVSQTDKLELIERMARSLRSGNGRAKPQSPERVAQRMAETAALSVQSARDAFSGRRHDTAYTKLRAEL